MPRSLAKSFEFDEFGSDNEAAEPVFTAADLETARREAREAALTSLIAEQANAQTELLEKIAAQLSAAEQDFEKALAQRRDSLIAAAREIVSAFCDGLAADRQIDFALKLLDKYLAAAPDQTPVTLFLPENTPAAEIAAVKKTIARRKAGKFASVKTSADVTRGDCRIEWRGGAVKRDLQKINEEIKTIIASVDSDVVAARDQKMRES